MTTTADVAGLVDCTCPRVRHVHGTRRAYLRHGCTCVDCAAANATYQRRLDRRNAALVWQGKTMWTSPVGTIRRLQALAADGWQLPKIAARIGVTPEAVSLIRATKRDRILTAKADQYTALYEQMWPATPPSSSGSTYARNDAERRGWAASWQWESIDIDDPAAVPLPLPDATVDDVKVQLACEGSTVDLNRAEKLEAVWTLLSRGLDDTQIGWRLDLSAAGVFKVRSRHFPHTIHRREQAA